MVPSYGYTQPISGYERDTAIVAKFFLYFLLYSFFFVLFSSREEWKVLTSGVGNQKSTLQPRSHLVA